MDKGPGTGARSRLDVSLRQRSLKLEMIASRMPRFFSKSSTVPNAATVKSLFFFSLINDTAPKSNAKAAQRQDLHGKGRRPALCRMVEKKSAPERARRGRGRERNRRCQNGRDQSSSGVKATTSSMADASAKSITTRSTPTAIPAASGMRDRSWRNASGMG